MPVDKQNIALEFGLCKDCREQMFITNVEEYNDPMTGETGTIITFDCAKCNNNKNKICLKQNRFSVQPLHDLIIRNGDNGFYIW